MLKKIQIAVLKFLVETVGQMSSGIAMAEKEGFISGHMLDYIYRNKPSGKNPLGVWIDSIFLSNPGWESVRLRRKNLVELLSKAIEMVVLEKDRVYICDIASGPAGYIFETLENFKGEKISLLLRDIDKRCLDDAKHKSISLGVESCEFQLANALNPEDFKFKSPPDIFVSSGFYDWINEDHEVRKSMKLIYDSLPLGGFFVFTNQVGHIDLELINGVFKDCNQNSLNMTIRKKEIINSWGEKIGFKTIESVTECFGYYSVSLMQKV